MAFDPSTARLDEFDPSTATPDGAGTTPKKRSIGDIAGDIGVTALKSAVGLPQSIVGLADIPTGGRVGKALEGIGYRPAETQKTLDALYSEPQQAANKAVRDAEGFVPTLKAAIDNPSAIATTIGESLPQMIGGTGIARGIIKGGAAIGTKVPAWLAGAAGEGAIGAGSAAENMRAQSEDGLLTPKQSIAAAGSGIGTAAFGAAGGKLAQRFGLGDVDTMLTQGGPQAAAAGAAKQGFLKQIAGSGLSEGVFEELPQSVQEQMWQNFGNDKPLTEGVGNAAAMGLLAGTAMGGIGGGYNALARQPEAVTPTPEAQPISGLLTSPAATGTPADQLIAGDVERANAVAAAQANADALYKSRADYEASQQTAPVPEVNPATGEAFTPDEVSAFQREQSANQTTLARDLEIRRTMDNEAKAQLGIGALGRAAAAGIDSGAITAEQILQPSMGVSHGATGSDAAVLAQESGQGRSGIGGQGVSNPVDKPDRGGPGLDTDAGRIAPGMRGDLPLSNENGGADAVINKPITVNASANKAVAADNTQISPRQNRAAWASLGGDVSANLPHNASRFNPSPADITAAARQLSITPQDARNALNVFQNEDVVAPNKVSPKQLVTQAQAESTTPKPATVTGPSAADIAAASRAPLAGGKPLSISGNKSQIDNKSAAKPVSTPDNKPIPIARVGTTPNNSEPITVKDGVVYMGKFSAQNFETGADITVGENADFAQVKKALQDGGALASKQKVYPGVFGSKAKQDQPVGAITSTNSTDTPGSDDVPSDSPNITQEPKAKGFTGNGKPSKLKAMIDARLAAKASKSKPSPYATKDPQAYAEAARDGLLKLLRKHGLSSKDASDLTGENAFKANQQNPKLFKGKTTLDKSVIPALVAEGYMTQQQVDDDATGGMSEAMDLIRAALTGNEFVGTFDQMERMGELEQLAEVAEADLQGQEEQAIVNELVGMDLTPDEFDTIFSGVPVDDASDQRNADILREQKNDAVKNAAVEAQAQEADARGTKAGAQGSEGKDGPQRIQAEGRTELDPEASQDEVDRRQDTTQRKKIADLTPDEMRRELLIDAMTGLGNRRAYQESTKLATQVSIDADGLKWINDNLGHESGDRLLETIGKVIAEETTNGFHISGDEYVIQTHTKEEADAIMARVVERLNSVTIESSTPDGEVVTMRGIGISYGINGDLNNAEKALREHKVQRERDGLRGGRGAIPPNAIIGKQSNQDSQDNASAEEEAARPELNLAGQTPAEIAAAEAASKKAAEKSARDDAKPTGPDVTADQVDLFNTQGGLFNQPAPRNEFIKAPDGSIDFGEITAEQSGVIKRQAGKIRLEQGVQNADGSGNGLAHIEARHGKEIRSSGYNSIESFVSDAVRHIDAIWKPGKTSQLIAVQAGNKGKVTFIELQPARDADGDYYRVNSAFPATDSYINRKEKNEGWKSLWSRDPVSADASGASGFADQSPNAGETTPTVSPQSGVGNIASDADQGKAGITDTHIDLFKRIKQGDVSAAEFKTAFDTLLNNKADVVSDLSGMTKDAIFQRFPGIVYRHKNDKKSDVIEAAYRDMVDDFTLGKSYSYGMGKDSQTNAIRALVNATTDQTLADYANDVKIAAEEREARGKVVAAGMDNPQTLEDFQRLIAARARDMGGNVTYQQVRMTLTPEQRKQFDILAAEKSRKERGTRKDADQNRVSAAGATTGAEIIATKHTRDGYDLFVVKAAERVERDVYNAWNAAAKKLGGWYSAFKGNGAIPGFQFKTLESAEAFQKYVSGGDTQAVQDQVRARRDEFADDRSQTAIERLNEMAGSLEEKADTSLNQDRKANTARRARMAASSEVSANSDKAMAQTMRNIAAAIEGGIAKLLDRVRQKVQVEMLRGFMHTAQSDKLRALYPSYAEQEKHKGEKPDAETADYVTFPTYTAFRSDLASLGRALLEVEGTKKLGQRLMKVADDVSDAYLKFARDNLDAVSVFRTKDGLRAAFPSKAMAEASVARSGYKGAAIVLPVKRNQNQIILSPSEAIKRGVWEGDNDKRISLSPEFGAELVEKIGKSAREKISVPWQFENAYDKRRRLAGMGIETPAELRAAMREFIALRAVPKEADKIKVMERAMIGRRNDGLDFFPTPASVADEMVEAAGVQAGMRVIEPSAGMGHIAERIRDAGVDPDVVEMASDRRGLLEAKGFNLVGNDFMDMKHLDPLKAMGRRTLERELENAQQIVAKGGDSRLVEQAQARLEAAESGVEGYDRIIMNPPFSDRRDAEHVQRAYELLKPGGRLVALMGEGVFFGKDKKAESFRDWMVQVGATDEKLDEGTFMDASLPVNTGVNARMVVIDKPGPEWKPSDTKETDTGMAMFQPDGSYDPYQTIETRPNTTPEQLSVGRAALNDAEKRILGPNADGFELLGSNISADFRANGGTSLIGQEVTGPEDLAFAAQVLRDPRFETFRVFYTDAAGKIVGERAYSSRLAGAVYLPQNHAAQIHIDMRVYGAAGYWLMHNHPSGSAEESRADLNLTASISKSAPGFKGHVVIDHNEYNHISVEGGVAIPNLVQASQLASIDLNANPEVSHPLLGEKVNGPAALAAIAKRLQTKDGYVVLVGTNGQQKISLLTEVPASYLKGIRGNKLKGLRAVAAIKRATGETGSTNLFAAVPSDVMDYGILLDSGILRDVVSMNGGKSAANQGLLEWKGVPVSNVARSGGKGYVAQPESGYKANEPIWSAPTPARMDTFLYEVQDKHIDTKRVIESIKAKINDLADEFNTYVKEALYHGRADKRTKDFLTDELTPLVDAMAKADVTQTQLNEYLHARHAIERNRVMRERNPDREDNTDLSGMSDDQANEILKKAPLKLAILAKRVDAIVAKSRQELVEYGLETQETVDAWSSLYKHYVPLKREGFDDTAGTGQGFSVRGSSTKEAVGSHRAVDNIFANIAMQRERNLTRGEKNRVALSLYGLAKTNPNSGFWKLDKPAQITQINVETGLPEVVPGDMADYKVPMVSYIGKDGTVQMRVDPSYKGRDNVVTVRIKGMDHAVIFNESDPRALRMAESLKNLDMDQMGEVIGSVGRVTRYIAAVNTQYNPVFGVTNLLRDVQTAMLNLQSTPLKGKQRDVMKEAVGALKGIYQDARAVRRGEHPDSEYAKDWDEFQRVGGQTGYRDMFRTSKDRAAAIEHMLDPAWWQKTYAGKLLTLNGVLAKPEQLLFNSVGKHLFRWLEDYNTSMENAMRLAAYRVGKRNGMSQEAAAFIAKSLTVNFNKKGRVATQAGALYAFFNASAQGTARIAETLRHGAKPGEMLGKTGKAIITGGITLGAMQAMLLLAAGFDEDEPPEFVRERNLIIPAPGTDKGYITIPMPLGFHVLPNIGRVLVEGSVYGKPLDRMADLMLTLFEAFNPIGTGASLAQTISPTVADPIVALSENKDWTGKRIFREDFSQLDPTPGFTRTKDNASILAKGLAYGINAITGGSDYTPGKFSPTPDQIDYLIGQATGGVGREVTKAATTAGSLITGEELPTYKIPLVGRLIGSAGGESGVRDKFYDNLRTLNLHEAEIQGRRDKREPVIDYLAEHPEARLAKYAGRVESKIREKKRMSKQAKEDGRDTRLIDAQIVNMMKQLNERVEGANP